MPLRESMQTRGRVEEAEESMQIRALFLATLLSTLAPAAGVRAAEAEAAADVRQASLFPRPADLEPQIRGAREEARLTYIGGGLGLRGADAGGRGQGGEQRC